MSTPLGEMPVAALYALLAAAVMAESVLLVGAFVPTLTLMLTAGALAHAGHLDLFLVIAVATAAVVGGDALAHRTGRLLRGGVRVGRLGRRVPPAAWERVEALMRRRGGQAVFVCRFVPVLRTVAPHLAGAGGLPYRRIAGYSAPAAAVWAGAEAGAGYVAAAVAPRAATYAGPVLAGVALGLVAVVLLGQRLRGQRPGRGVAGGGAADGCTDPGGAAHGCTDPGGAAHGVPGRGTVGAPAVAGGVPPVR